jgi:hypothetical protein
MKIRVTIDTDECSFDSMNESSYTSGVVGMTIDGVGRWWYGSFNEFVTFRDVKVLECKHDSRERETNNCGDCGKDMNEVIINE